MIETIYWNVLCFKYTSYTQILPIQTTNPYRNCEEMCFSKCQHVFINKDSSSFLLSSVCKTCENTHQDQVRTTNKYLCICHCDNQKRVFINFTMNTYSTLCFIPNAHSMINCTHINLHYLYNRGHFHQYIY